MNFFEKYLKYKSKYLRLKNIFSVTGGDKPVTEILKNINLFYDKPELESFLNPVYGFILNETSFIINHYNFYDVNAIDNDTKNIFTLVHKLFIKIDVSNEIKPTKRLFELDTRDIGRLLAFLYLRYIKFKDHVDVIKNLINKIDSLIKNIQSFTTKQNFSKLGFDKKTKLCSLKDSVDANIKLLYDNDFFNITIQDVQFEKPEYANRYINNSLVNALIKYKVQLGKIINKPDFKSKYVNSLIVNNINLDKIDKDIFHVILAVGWWISNNKQNIRYYYEGLNEILPSNMQVTLPEYFDDELFTRTELVNKKPESFELALAITYNNYISSVKIISYENASTLHGSTFPDCGETSLRNFINVILYDRITNIFDVDKLKSIGANEIILNYYSIFNTINKHVSVDEQLIYGKLMNARDAWTVVVSNIQHIGYNHQETLPNGDIYKYEILSGLSDIRINDKQIVNMLAVIQNLFTSIKNWSDLNILISNINVNLDDTGHGTIDFETSNVKYTWKFMNGHYAFEQNKNDYVIDLSNLTEKESAYVNCITSHINDDLFLNYFYYIKLENELLTEKINSVIYHDFDENDYQRILNYARKNFDRQQKLHIIINFGKIKDIGKYILSEYNIFVIYDGSGFRNYENIREIDKCDISNALNKFVNLERVKYSETFDELSGDILEKLVKVQTLEFDSFYNKQIGTSLKSFLNLKTVIFGYNFNQVLSTSLESLEKIENLSFGYDFNQVLSTSLESLEKLQSLTFGNSFNQDLSTSLESLEKLQTLTFGNNFNQDLGTSLDKLTTLQTLTFGNSFNRDFGTSLDKLINLKSLIFGTDFGTDFDQDLITSLDKLNNLESLTFGNNFNQNLGTSLTLLVNLKNLTFGRYYNKQLITSLDKLTNLQNLTLGDNFNQELSTSFNSLTKLQKLTFGEKFNQKLNTSLNSLIDLKFLAFGEKFNQKLNTSLNSLTNLQNLTFGKKFNQNLSTSLNSLINLKSLRFGDKFDQNLNTSLNLLTNLQNLSFGEEFNQKINSSFNSLTNLKTLIFGKDFNQKINTSLDSLVNLKTLVFGNYFNQEFGTSLNSLVNLQTLSLGNKFVQKLGNSLESLVNLKNLYFGVSFDDGLGISFEQFEQFEQFEPLENLSLSLSLSLSDFSQDLGTSLNNLTNLQILMFGDNFDQELNGSLDKLTNLQTLIFGAKFNKKLGTSLDKLTNLQILEFGYNFNRELITSLDTLTNLESLTFGNSFEQELNNSLDKLVNLQNLTFGSKFNLEFGTSLDSLVKLKILTLGSDYNKKMGTSLDKLISLENIY
jgi:hypothetical protein